MTSVWCWKQDTHQPEVQQLQGKNMKLAYFYWLGENIYADNLHQQMSFSYSQTNNEQPHSLLDCHPLHQLLYRLSRDNLTNIFIYQIIPITLNCFLVFVYRVLEATL